MSDTNEERLLSDLLRDLASADADLAASEDLARRVMTAWDDRLTMAARRWTVDDGRWAIVDRPRAALGAAGLVAAAVALAVATVTHLGVAADTPQKRAAAQEPPVVVSTLQADRLIREVPIVSRRAPPKRTAERRPPPESPGEVVSFVPLVPMAAGEWSGPFSIARVQIGQTEADVLLGEDGMARAIRVSANGSVPWRLK